ncbi:MAG: response regulator [Chloroflexi bacterium]|nr:response regulator [Chloroflexota bacterium]
MTQERVKILVVDDEEMVRKLLQTTLRQAGYEVATAEDGNKALNEVSSGGANVIILDIKMPGLSGMEVLRRLTAHWPAYCVIMITAIADIETAVEAMKLGAYDYMTKPFDLSRVNQKVQNAISKWRSDKQEKDRYVELSESVAKQAEQMQTQFIELVQSLGREHKLLRELAARQPDRGKAMLSRLPQELQEPISSFEDFRDAMLRILKRS